MSDHGTHSGPAHAGPPESSDGSRPKRRQWLLLAAVVALLAGLTLWPALDTLRPVRDVRVAAVLPVQAPRVASPADAPADPAVGAPTTPAVRTVQAPGWVEPDPFYIAVSALTDGVVESMHVLEGQSVEEGQVIAELVPDDAALALRQAEARVATAEAQLARARADLAAAQTDWDEPVERERSVAVAGAALAEAEAELASLPSRVREAEAVLARLNEEMERIVRAFGSGAATERERLVAEYQVASQDAALEAIRLERPLLEAKVDRLKAEATAAERAAALRVTEKQALDAAVARVADAEAMLAQMQARRAEAQLRMDRMTIRAPMDGLVLRRLKAPGDKVLFGMDSEHSAHLVHLYDPAKLQVRVDVPLADASQVYIGQRCEVVVDVLPDEVFAGEVTRITHEADLQKNTLQIKVRVIDPSPLLKPEMLARVRFLGGAPGDGGFRNAAPTRHRIQADQARVRVPEDCLDGQRVWVVRHRRGPRGEAVQTPVRVLGRADGFATIAAPLRVGDLLIRTPDGLTPDARVRITGGEGGDA